jgi:hypothetical protein
MMNCQRCEKYAHCRLRGIKSTFRIAKNIAARVISGTSPTAIYLLKLVKHSSLGTTAILRPISALEKKNMQYEMLCTVKAPTRRGKMIENGLIITGSDAELLSRALADVKTKTYEESEISLNDTQALDALVSCFRAAEKQEQEKERRHAFLNLLRKRLVLGTLVDRPGGADSRES